MNIEPSFFKELLCTKEYYFQHEKIKSHFMYTFNSYKNECYIFKIDNVPILKCRLAKCFDGINRIDRTQMHLCIPLFNSFWVEWTHKSDVFEFEGKTQKFSDGKSGIFACRSTGSMVKGIETINWTLFSFIKSKDICGGKIVCNGHAIFDSKKDIDGLYKVTIEEMKEEFRICDDDDYKPIFFEDDCIRWLGLHYFLSAKNVKVEPRNFNDGFIKHCNKHKIKAECRYHEIVITKPGKQYDSGISLGSGEKMPLHICRGHLRTYSDEKPLFGKYSGIYFIPSHVRGSIKNGIVNKSYKLK